MSPRKGKVFGAIWGTGEQSVILTEPGEKKSLYLVWEINFLMMEKYCRKKKSQIKEHKIKKK